MRIVLTTNFSPWSNYSGGGQRSTHQLATALTKLGHEVLVVYTKAPRETVEVPDDLVYEIRWASFFGLSSRRSAPLRPLNAVTVRQVIRDIYEEAPIDVVHSQGEEGALLHRLRAEMPFGLVVTPRYPWYPKRLRPHASLLDQARLWLFDAKYPVLGRLVKHADWICPTSTSAAESIEEAFGVSPERIEVVPNGINPLFWDRAWSGDVMDSERRAVFYGRLDYDKGLDVLLDAMVDIETLKLHVIGRGDLEVTLKDRAAELGIDHRIVWTPWCAPAELVRILEKSRLSILPSRHESFGNVMAESMAVGVPLITCRAGSIPEVVGDHAWLVSPGDSDGLRDVIAKVTADQKAALKRANMGRKFVRDRYHWTEVASRFVTIYERCAR